MFPRIYRIVPVFFHVIKKIVNAYEQLLFPGFETTHKTLVLNKHFSFKYKSSACNVAFPIIMLGWSTLVSISYTIHDILVDTA